MLYNSHGGEGRDSFLPNSKNRFLTTSNHAYMRGRSYDSSYRKPREGGFKTSGTNRERAFDRGNAFLSAQARFIAKRTRRVLKGRCCSIDGRRKFEITLPRSAEPSLQSGQCRAKFRNERHRNCRGAYNASVRDRIDNGIDRSARFGSYLPRGSKGRHESLVLDQPAECHVSPDTATNQDRFSPKDATVTPLETLHKEFSRKAYCRPLREALSCKKTGIWLQSGTEKQGGVDSIAPLHLCGSSSSWQSSFLHTSTSDLDYNPKVQSSLSERKVARCAAVSLTLPLPASKRPRLGWGQGLAKYEGTKTEGNEGRPMMKRDIVGDDSSWSAAVFGSGPSEINVHFTHTLDKNPDMPLELPMEGISCKDAQMKTGTLEGQTSVRHWFEGNVQETGQAEYWERWSKAEILQQVEKIEQEIDMVEKELVKADCYEHFDKNGGLDKSCQVDWEVYYKNRSGKTCLEAEKGLYTDYQKHRKRISASMEVGASSSAGVSLSSCTGRSLHENASNISYSQQRTNTRIDAQDILEDCEVMAIDSKGQIFETQKEQTSVLYQSKASSVSFCFDVHNKAHQRRVSKLIQSNKEQARKSSESLAHLLTQGCDLSMDKFLPSKLEITPAWNYNMDSHEKIRKFWSERIIKRRSARHFKERVLAFKYCSLKEIWRHEQLATRQRRERHKRLRSLRYALTATDISLEELKMMKKLKDEVQHRCLNRVLRMPALIIDQEEKSLCRFLTRNGLVDDPISLEKERSIINPWTPEERRIFYEKFSVLNKNFRQIATFLNQKTTADCIEFYYRNQKSDEFPKVRHKTHARKHKDSSHATGSYLATTTRSSRYCESNAVCAETLSKLCITSKELAKAAKLKLQKEAEIFRISMTTDSVSHESQMSLRSISGHEPQTDTGTLIEAVSPCISSAATSFTNCCNDKYLQKVHTLGLPSDSSIMEPLTEGEGSRAIIVRRESARVNDEIMDSEWSDNERLLFMTGIAVFGKDFKRISEQVVSKNEGQCKAFFSKTRKRLRLDHLLQHRQAICAPANVPNAEESKFMKHMDIPKLKYLVQRVKGTEVYPKAGEYNRDIDKLSNEDKEVAKDIGAGEETGQAHMDFPMMVVNVESADAEELEVERHECAITTDEISSKQQERTEASNQVTLVGSQASELLHENHKELGEGDFLLCPDKEHQVAVTVPFCGITGQCQIEAFQERICEVIGNLGSDHPIVCHAPEKMVHENFLPLQISPALYGASSTPFNILATEMGIVFGSRSDEKLEKEELAKVKRVATVRSRLH